MSKRTIIFIIIILIIFFIVKILPMLGSEEEKIKKIIYAAKTATEEEKLLKCMSYISMDYDDKHGNRRGNLFIIGQNVFKTYDDILILIEDLGINVEDSTSAKAHIVVSGQGRRSGEEKLRYLWDTEKVELNVDFKKEGNDWKVAKLDFIEPEDFMNFLKGL
ncbi:hypothetical protein ACFL2J_04165 [Candidatus Omnitrophota bacterium]